MRARVSDRLIDIASTVASATAARGGQRVSPLHAALLASRLFEAIKQERAAIDPADLPTCALLDDALDSCKRLAQAGDRLPILLRAVSDSLARGDVPPKPAKRVRRAAAAAPLPRLRLFQLIEGGR
jgi:hypothetical protein